MNCVRKILFSMWLCCHLHFHSHHSSQLIRFQTPVRPLNKKQQTPVLQSKTIVQEPTATPVLLFKKITNSDVLDPASASATTTDSTSFVENNVVNSDTFSAAEQNVSNTDDASSTVKKNSTRGNVDDNSSVQKKVSWYCDARHNHIIRKRNMLPR